jgi:predicted RNA-binding Zn ribbon-like protein
MITSKSDERQFDLTGGRVCLDFTNTLVGSREHPKENLESYDDLVAWSRQSGVLTDGEARRLVREARQRPGDAAATLFQALTLRETIFRTFARVAEGRSPDADDIAALNAALAHALPHLRIETSGDAFSWTWHAEAGDLDRMLWTVARSAADLLVSQDERGRVRRCAGTDCDWLFMDTSRNSSRRWCDMRSCGNRAKAHRYYERQKRTGARARRA